MSDTKAMDIAQIKATLVKLAQQPKCQDWHAKVQYVSKAIWAEIDLLATTNPRIIDDMTALLQDEDAFSVAQHVVPAFRKCKTRAATQSQSQADSDARSRVLRNLDHRHCQTGHVAGAVQSDAIGALYRAEKHAFYDADTLRARLFLRRNEDFSESEKLALQKWLDECPVKPRSKDPAGYVLFGHRVEM